MKEIENLQCGKPLIQHAQRLQPRLRTIVEKFVLPAFRKRELEDLPAACDYGSAEGGFLRVFENQERASFSAEFSCELAGIVWNGRTRNNVGRRQDAFVTSGDRLASKLLPLLSKNAEVRFMYGGSAATNFSWSIQGIVREAASREIAIAEASGLRQCLQMVLASEPSFKFVPEVHSAREQPEQPVPSWKTKIVPRRISLKIPNQSAFGFGRGNCETKANEMSIGIGLPRSGATSFRSLAEAVLLNTNPILLVVGFTRFDLGEESRSIASEALKWMRRNPDQFQNQLAAAGIEPGLSDNIQEHFQEWLRNPTGGRVSCSILSSERPVGSFVEMVGEDVFGTRVEAVAAPLESREAEIGDGGVPVESENLDLSCCLRSGAAWPSLFPSLESI